MCKGENRMSEWDVRLLEVKCWGSEHPKIKTTVCETCGHKTGKATVEVGTGTPEVWLMIDDCGDPSFYCQYCDTERNHVGVGKRGKWYKNHEVTEIGRFTYEELREWMENKK